MTNIMVNGALLIALSKKTPCFHNIRQNEQTPSKNLKCQTKSNNLMTIVDMYTLPPPKKKSPNHDKIEWASSYIEKLP